MPSLGRGNRGGPALTRHQRIPVEARDMEKALHGACVLLQPLAHHLSPGSDPGWMGFGATWDRGSCPCPW